MSPQSHRTVGCLWRESHLNWTDFLSEGEDVQAFISQQVGNKGKLRNIHILGKLRFIHFFDTNVTQEVDRAHYNATPSCIVLSPLSFFHHLSLICDFLIVSMSSQKLQFVLSDGSGPEAALSKRILSPEELSQQLERLLLEDMASDEQIFDWVEVRDLTHVYHRPATPSHRAADRYRAARVRQIIKNKQLNEKD